VIPHSVAAERVRQAQPENKKKTQTKETKKDAKTNEQKREIIGVLVLHRALK